MFNTLDELSHTIEYFQLNIEIENSHLNLVIVC